MNCPYDAGLDVGPRCTHRACWMWSQHVDSRCTVQHVGNVAVLPVDVQRLRGSSATDVALRVENGRRLMQAWLRVVRAAAEVHVGCPHCGLPGDAS